MKKRYFVFGFAAFAAALAVMYFLKTPRADRAWVPDLAEQARVETEGDIVRIQNYRDWRWDQAGAARETWTTSPAFRTADVRAAYLVVEPHPSMTIMAHTLVIFSFEDSALIGLSVEARKEAGEKYSPYKGAIREYELSYQWASPQDLLTRRAVTLKRDLFMYPLALSQAELETYLHTLIERTRALESRPRFYNTLHSNCTNELAKSAKLPWDPAFIFTGKAAEALDRMGRIAGAGDFAAKKNRAHIDETVRAAASLSEAEFNAALLSALTAAPPE
jgi:hypothetical protein